MPLLAAARALVSATPKERVSTRTVNLRSLEDPFIENWGTIADAFGMHRGTGKVHAVVYLSLEHLTVHEIGERLHMGPDQAAAHLRQLCDWGVVHGKPGSRDGAEVTVYDAERDPWTWFLQTLRERRHREFVPLLLSVRNVSDYSAEIMQAVDPEERARIMEMHHRIVRFNAFFEELAQLIDTMAKLGKGPLFKALKMASRFVR